MSHQNVKKNATTLALPSCLLCKFCLSHLGELGNVPATAAKQHCAGQDVVLSMTIAVHANACTSGLVMLDKQPHIENKTRQLQIPVLHLWHGHFSMKHA